MHLFCVFGYVPNVHRIIILYLLCLDKIYAYMFWGSQYYIDNCNIIFLISNCYSIKCSKVLYSNYNFWKSKNGDIFFCTTLFAYVFGITYLYFIVFRNTQTKWTCIHSKYFKVVARYMLCCVGWKYYDLEKDWVLSQG